MKKRTELEEISGIRSSYKNSEGENLDISKLKNLKYVTKDMSIALHKLKDAVEGEGGSFYISDLFRQWNIQKEAHELWLRRKRKAFAAPPGYSFHMAGRAVDIDIYNLNFNIDKSLWLTRLWSLAKPIGFHPIINKPDNKISEAWHFEYPGYDWGVVYGKMKNKEIAKAAVVDAGLWQGVTDPHIQDVMFIQSQLIRLGHTSIVVDGIAGQETKKILKMYWTHDVDLSEAGNILMQKVLKLI